MSTAGQDGESETLNQNFEPSSSHFRASHRPLKKDRGGFLSLKAKTSKFLNNILNKLYGLSIYLIYLMRVYLKNSRKIAIFFGSTTWREKKERKEEGFVK